MSDRERHPEDYCTRCRIYIGPGSPHDRGDLCKGLCEECENADAEEAEESEAL